MNKELRLTLYLIKESLSLNQIELAKKHTEEAIEMIKREEV